MLMKKIRLGDLLIQKGKINEADIKKALDIQRTQNSHKKLGEILIEEGFISEDDIIKLIAEQLHIDVINFDNTELNFSLLRKVPVAVLEKYEALPIKETPKEVIVAFTDPMNIDARTVLQRYLKKPIKLTIAPSKDIKKHINQLKNREKANALIERMKKELAGTAEDNDDEESATMQFIKYIVNLSIQKGASDIHIETEEDIMQIRARIDGSLQELLIVEKEFFSAIAARIKLLSNLNISEKRKPQDGRFSMELDEHHFDFRVSTLPIATGESIVIRILDKRNVMKKLEEVGISSKNLVKLEKALKTPNGIVLVTGPTGSGKSTTLYAALNKIKNVEEKIITVEDPVEYQMRLINQVNVNEAAGLTFAAALRSILRQDPDIIMIGEIRDLETLEIAIKAALTGHLVISTLHTNDAVSAISRMIDMGADPFMVGAAVVAVEAQRLVKKICPYCKTKEKPKAALLEPIKELLPQNATFYKGKGCDECNMTGYKGRTLISEVFTIDEELSSDIAKNISLVELEKKAKQKGYEPMFMDGLIKALKGETTLEEIYRVAKVNK
jgi:general secretion pathway protein E/type IV pilus assembly protein PilB